MPGLAFVGKTLAVSMPGFGFWWKNKQNMAVSMPVLAFEGKSPCSLSGLSSGILILAVSMPGFSLGEGEWGGGGGGEP